MIMILEQLLDLELPQLIRFRSRAGEKKQLGMGSEDPAAFFASLSSRRVLDIYRRVQHKYLRDQVVSEQQQPEESLDVWLFLERFLSSFWETRSVFESKSADHSYVRQLLKAFYFVFRKGVFLTVLQEEPSKFLAVYHVFVEFLKGSVISAVLEDQFIATLVQSSKNGSKTSNQEDLAENLQTILNEEGNDTQNGGEAGRRRALGKQSTNNKCLLWMEELIEILRLLEQFQQSRMLDDFVQDTGMDRIFDELCFLEKSALPKKKLDSYANKLKIMKKKSSHFIQRKTMSAKGQKPEEVKQAETNKQQQSHIEAVTNEEINKLLRDISSSKRITILEYMGKLKHVDTSIVYYLIELLTFNQTKLSAAVTEIIWNIYTTKSNFLAALNNLWVLEAREHHYLLNKQQVDEHYEWDSCSIYTEFTAAFWKIHFALNSLSSSGEDSGVVKLHQELSDALTDLLLIFYPDYAAKEDAQVFMELNGLENEENHKAALSLRSAKSKIRQEQLVDMIDRGVGQPAGSLVDDGSSDEVDEAKKDGSQGLQDSGKDAPRAAAGEENGLMWRLTSSLSVEVGPIVIRQRMLRYLGFHQLISRLLNSLIDETNGSILREKAGRSREWELKSEIFEKAILFLIYFVVRSEENQELIVKLGEGQKSHKESFLVQLVGVEKKQFQYLTFVLFAELFKDNYTALFSLERFAEDSGVRMGLGNICHQLLAKMFKKFEMNVKDRHFDSCVYFLQFLQSLLQVRGCEIVQNRELLASMFRGSKAELVKTFSTQLETVAGWRVESYLRGGASEVDVPVELLFLEEFLALVRQLGSGGSVMVVGDFAKTFLGVGRISALLERMDDWFSLKLELLRYFCAVYLSDLSVCGSEERAEVERTVVGTVLKQLASGCIKSRYGGAVMVNSGVFNIFNRRTLHSDVELVMRVGVDTACLQYFVFGVNEVLRQYFEKLFPKWVAGGKGDRSQPPDKASQDEVIFLAESIDELLSGAAAQLFERTGQATQKDKAPKKAKSMGGSGDVGKGSEKLSEADRLRRRSRYLTSQIMRAAHNDTEQDQEPEEINTEQNIEIPEDDLDSKEKICAVHRLVMEVANSNFAVTQNAHARMSGQEKMVLSKWELMIGSQRRRVIEEYLIHNERESELQRIVNLIVTLKRDDTQKFKNIVRALILLLSDDGVVSETKLKSMTILRKLSSYRDDPAVTSSILCDLGELGFTSVLCDLISQEENSEQKLEYIKGFVEFLDDSSREVQMTFLLYLQSDAINRYNRELINFYLSFLFSLQRFVSSTFQDIRMSERGRSRGGREQRGKLRRMLQGKINACILVFELLRLGCENHYLEMQGFLREQPRSRKPLNFIVFAADMFERYSKIMNEGNSALGEKLLDFMIEATQGPCLENQKEVCQKTRILEVLEEVSLTLRSGGGKKESAFSSFRFKMVLLQLSMMEGNVDEEIPKKIAQFFNAQLVLERLERNYWALIKNTSELKADFANQAKGKDTVGGGRSQINYGLINTQETMVTSSEEIIELLDDFWQERNDTTASDLRGALQSSPEEEENAEQVFNESFMMYILLKKLKKYVPQIKEFTVNSDKRLGKALAYFRANTASIEIINMHGKLEKIHFPLPRLMGYLSEESKVSFLETVGRDSANDKVNGLLDEVSGFFMEMSYFLRLRRLGLRYNNNVLVYLRNFCLGVALVINVLVIAGDDASAGAARVLGILAVILYSSILLLWLIFRMQLEYQKIYKRVEDFIELAFLKRKRQGRRGDSATGISPTFVIYPLRVKLIQNVLVLYSLVVNSYSIYWVLLVVCSVLGLLVSKIFYGLLLLDIIDHSVVLKNVIKSITLNYKQLVMTTVLGLMVLYLYSLIAYQSPEFRDSMQDGNETSICETQFQCLIFIIHQGLRAGGGIGDVLVAPDPNVDESNYALRVIYDLSFFAIINIIWLNIIFGIIIDTFAELRDNKNQRDFDSQNRCFICNLSRTLFEKEGVSFDNHIQKQHNPWSYLAYLIYLMVKEQTEHTGIESYVFAKFSNGDISWLPIQKALSLEMLGVEIKEDS